MATRRNRPTLAGDRIYLIDSQGRVAYGKTLYLLPVHSSDTQWYRNVLKNPSIRVDARGEEADFRAVPTEDVESLKWLIGKFGEKYGAVT